MSPKLPVNWRIRPELLRRADQVSIAGLTLFALMAMGLWWLAQGGASGRLIEIDRVDPLAVEFKVDINSADWPELVVLPDIGETLARRIVDYRQTHGPFRSLEDLGNVRGIGPKTLDGIRFYLQPIDPTQVAGQ
jgi:competence protein ComEA